MVKHVVFLASVLLASVGHCQVPETVIPAIDEGPTKAKDYNWLARHQQVVNRVKQGNVDLVMIGDSITHMWESRATTLWDKYYAPRNAVNLGFGWDRTQHVLWRLDNGELDGIKPKVAVLMIGTNNIGSNSPTDIVKGVTAIVSRIFKKTPNTQILLLGIFPRDEKPDTFARKQIREVNQQLEKFGDIRRVTYLDLGPIFLQPDGTISKEIMPDFLHPSAKGYELWAKAMEPTLAKLFGDKPAVKGVSGMISLQM